MMNSTSSTCFTAFAGTRQIASGYLRDVVYKVRVLDIKYDLTPVLIFDDATSKVVEMNLRGTPQDLLHRIAEIESAASQMNEPALPAGGSRGPGRPKLGVVAREVTLLPRHWNWLASQPGGASVALRKLVEEARRTNQSKDRLRLAQEAAYRFLSAMAGNEPGFEEATRALFAGDQERFAQLVEPWPTDVGIHAKKLASRAFEDQVSEPRPRSTPRYTLDELLAECNSPRQMPHEDRDQSDAPRVGRELL
jgi:uncharacterized protein